MKRHIRNMNYSDQKPYSLHMVNTANIKAGLYQRALDTKKIERIVASFDERIANEPKVSFRNGSYYVFDGQHTIVARKKLNGNKDLFVLCKVYEDMTEEDEAILFARQTGVSSKPTPGVTLRALNIGNDQEALDFVETNLSIGISPSYTLIKGMYRLRCINTAMNQFHRIGKVLYKESLSILLEAWKDNPKALHGAVVETMCTFVKTYMGEYNHEWLVRKLSYSNPYDIVIKAKSLDTDGGPKSALQHILDIYNYNNPKPLPVSF